MDEQAEEVYEEEYEEYVGGGNSKWLWAAFILAAVAAITFAVLWYLRGGRVASLGTELANAQAGAASATQRLENDLRTARTDVENGNKRFADLEKRMNDEIQRANDARQQSERSLRSDLDLANSRFATASRELEALKAANPSDNNDGLVATLRDQLSTAQKAHQLVSANHIASAKKAMDSARALAAANARIAELEGTVGDLKANVSHIGKELQSSNEELTRLQAREPQDKALADLRTQLAAAQKENGDLAKRATDAESALAKAKETIAGLEGTVGDLKASVANISRELTTSNEELAQLRSKAPQDGIVTDLRARLTEAAAALAAAKTAHADLEKEHKTLGLVSGREKSAAGEREAQLQARIESLTGELAAAKKAGQGASDQMAALRKRMDADAKQFAERAKAASDSSEERIARLEKEYQSKLKTAEKRLADQDAAWRKKARDEEEEWRKKLDGETTALKSAFDNERESLLALVKNEKTTAEKQVASTGSELRQQLEKTQAELARLKASTEKTRAAEQAEWEKRLEAVKQQAADAAAQAKTKLDAATKQASDAYEALIKAQEQARAAKAEAEKAAAEKVAAPVAAAPAPEPDEATNVVTLPDPGTPAAHRDHDIVLNPQRHLGQIVELLSDGRTYLINAGSNQGLAPGMRFDVHRQSDERNRYVGHLEVTSVLSGDFSMAVALPDEAVMMCPVTGRAVRSGRETSPFAKGPGGRAVPVRSSTELGVVGDTPAIGDFIDNPL